MIWNSYDSYNQESRADLTCSFFNAGTNNCCPCAVSTASRITLLLHGNYKKINHGTQEGTRYALIPSQITKNDGHLLIEMAQYFLVHKNSNRCLTIKYSPHSEKYILHIFDNFYFIKLIQAKIAQITIKLKPQSFWFRSMTFSFCISCIGVMLQEINQFFP